MKFNPNTPLWFYVHESTYIPGEGNTTIWRRLETDGYSTFYSEWKGGFGERALSAQAMGVNDMATIRAFFNPTIYEKMRIKKVIVIKNMDSLAIKEGMPDKHNPNVYEVWGSVDNVNEENQVMEFRVRRYEGI